jgi:hypothetical protein
MSAPEPGNRLSSRIAALALCLAMVGAASMLYYHLGLFLPRAREVNTARGLGNGYAFGDDFYPIWLTARQWRVAHRDPYSPEMTREIQKGLFGRPLDPRLPTDPIDLRMFAHPAYADLLFWPVAELPFPEARVVVVAFLALATLASVLLWTQTLSWRLSWICLAVVSLLTVCSYPALEGLHAGQVGLLVAFLLAASVFSLQRGKLLLAGILAALSTIKPQIALLAVFYLLVWSFHDWRNRRRFCMGFLLAMLSLVGASLMVWPHWVQSWIHALLEYHRYAQPALISQVLVSWVGPGWAGPAAFIAIAGLIVIAMARIWQSRAAAPNSLRFCFTFNLVLAITAVTLLPGQAVYDHVILLPGILLLLQHVREFWRAGRVPRTLLAVGALVLFWPWAAAFALIAAHPWLKQDHFSSGLLALPIRTAAALPFTVLVLLFYFRRASAAATGELS